MGGGPTGIGPTPPSVVPSTIIHREGGASYLFLAVSKLRFALTGPTFLNIIFVFRFCVFIGRAGLL
eukprot:NODE_3692_length_384_cov_161.746269_g3126_i0.p1 GENE.NODE_3692_length_384_cov_161.746269_g3126_i0~~NODE_3692_length_384_cov_161.746269_g3126_i0.p1  ORF type:complete len:76 (-),score=18.98 NODE_3692_length_384_cov_161.746269_g3126_i0:155-352(-)